MMWHTPDDSRPAVPSLNPTAVSSRPALRPMSMAFRLTRAPGIARSVFGLLLAAAAFTIRYLAGGHPNSLAQLLMLALGVLAVVSIGRGLFRVFDRSPHVVLDENGLTDTTTGILRVTPWHAVPGLHLQRHLRNGVETSATLIVQLRTGDTLSIDLTALDMGSEFIARNAEAWANAR